MFGIRPISTRFVGQVGFDQKGDKQVASIVAAVSLSAFGMHGLAAFLVQRPLCATVNSFIKHF